MSIFFRSTLCVSVAMAALALQSCSGVAQEDVDAINGKLDNLSAKIEQQEREFASSHQGYMSRLGTAHQSYMNKLSSAEQQVDRFAQKAQALIEQAGKEAKAQIAANQQNVQDLRSQLSAIKRECAAVQQQISKLSTMMEEQNTRVDELTKLYKETNFISLSDMNGEKLQTTSLPAGAIGEFIIQGDSSVTLFGRDSRNALGTLMAVGTGRWWINGKEYTYEDTLTYTVEVYEDQESHSVTFWGEDVTYTRSNGTVATDRIRAIPAGNDSVARNMRVPGYTKGTKIGFPIPHGTTILMALDKPIPVVVK